MFWDRIDKSKVKGIENKLFDNIHRSFLDTDDNIVYIISDVVRPSKISKTKKGRVERSTRCCRVLFMQKLLKNLLYYDVATVL